MSTLKFSKTYVIWLFSGSLLLSLLTATNADYALQFVVEGFICTACLAIIASQASLFRQALWNNKLLKFWTICGFVLICLLAVRVVFSLRADAHLSMTRACMHYFPDMFARFECLYAQDFSRNTGLRQLTFHVTAFLVALTSCLVARGVRKSPGKLLAFNALYSVVAGMTLCIYIWGGQSGAFLGPAWLHNEFSAKLGTYFITNPGWLWPLLLPGFCMALWVAWIRGSFAHWILALAGSYCFLISRRRGAYVALAGVVGMYGAAWLLRSSKAHVKIRKNFWTFLSIASLLSVFGGLLLLSQKSVVKWGVLKGLALLGVEATKNPFSVSKERLDIWSTALRGIAAKPFEGHGYASWYARYLDYAKTSGERLYHFPTAHNLWIQSAFELGLIQSGLILLWLVTPLVWILWRFRRQKSASDVMLVLSYSFAALATSLLQEIDHVNTIYYQFALLGGLVLSFVTPTPEGPLPRRRAYVLDPTRTFFYGLTLLFAAATILYLLRGSTGGQAFSFGNGRLVRTFRPAGTLFLPGPKAAQDFALLPVKFFKGNQTSLLTSLGIHQDHAISFMKDEIGHPVSYLYRAERYATDMQNAFAFEVTYPSLLSRFLFKQAEGIWPLEVSSEQPYRNEFWCARTCRFSLLMKQNCRNPRLVLGAPRPDVTQETPLQVLIWQGSEKASLTFSSPQDKKDIAVRHSVCDDGVCEAKNLVIEAERVFNPARAAASADDRDLGVKILDVACQ